MKCIFLLEKKHVFELLFIKFNFNYNIVYKNKNNVLMIRLFLKV